jgi:ABC-type branched-chain amino acid transport systems, ATPase component
MTGRTPDAALLEVRGVVRRFGGVIALSGVDLTVSHGQTHALIGPNGSGKSTLINCVSGVDRWDHGTIRLRGVPITPRAPRVAAGLGIARTFQTLRLFGELSVLDNVLVPMHRRHGYGLLAAMTRWPGAVRAERRMREEGRELLARVGIADLADRAARTLPYGHQRLVEIARALALHPSLLLLDEPAAGLNDAETARLTELVGELGGGDLALLVVEHNMDFVMEVSDQVTVLENGRLIAAGTPAQVRAHPEVLRAYLGTAAREEIR